MNFMKYIFIGIFLLSVNALADITTIYSIKKDGFEDVNKAEAKIKLSYDISKLGTPININVIESTDKSFNKKAMAVLERRKFEPKELSGVKVVNKNSVIEIVFYDYPEK